MLYEIRFKCPCPNVRCPNRGKLRSWTHSGCNGELYINKYGMINCKKCGEDCHVFDSKFKCSDEENFGKSYRTSIIQACANVDHLDDGDDEKRDFCEEFLIKLIEEHRNREKDNNNNNFRKSLYLID